MMVGKLVETDASYPGISLEIGIIVGGNDDFRVEEVVGMHQIFSEYLMIVLFEELVSPFNGCRGHTLTEELHNFTMMNDEIVGPC